MNPRFLIVDDHDELRALLRVMLDSHGCDCDEAADGVEALKILEDPAEAEKYDAIFLDVMMPKLSGHAVVKRLRQWEHTAELPVIMLTAMGEGDDFIEGYQNGASYYISKPFTNEQIVYGLDLIFGEDEQDPDQASAA